MFEFGDGQRLGPEFLADRSADKRSKLIDRLLADSRWADHWMGYWQDLLAENPTMINATQNSTGADVEDQLFGERFLLERPLLQAVRAGDSCVLLIDEVDRADDEFEAFLLELLGDFQVTIPEIGTIAATSRPIVILTSNRTRELHDALKRRCLYTWIGFPDAERETEIVRTRLPAVSAELTAQVAARLRA